MFRHFGRKPRAISSILSLVFLLISWECHAFKVLFIGNSFTGFSSPVIKSFNAVSPLGDDEIAFIFAGGRFLTYHLEQQRTLDIIANNEWDYVVLQDHSRSTLLDLASFENSVREFTKIIRKSGAEPILFQTWARLQGSNYRLKQIAVNERYDNIAAELDLHVMRIGKVWLSAYQTNRPFFDRLFDNDQIHQTRLGSGIVAAAVFKTLYDTDLAWAPIDSVSRQFVLNNIETRAPFTNRNVTAKKLAGMSATLQLLID